MPYNGRNRRNQVKGEKYRKAERRERKRKRKQATVWGDPTLLLLSCYYTTFTTVTYTRHRVYKVPWILLKHTEGIVQIK